MGPIKHLAYSTALGTTLLITTKSPKTAMACVFAGTMVDLDHVIEYGIYCKDFAQEWDWNLFASGKYFDYKGTVKVIFHSWEFAIVLWLYLFTKKRKNGILYGIACGYTLHLVLDHIGNDVNNKAYFELFRIKNHWKQSALKENCL